ncbi:MAG: NAD(P)-binding domain-containing protein, partial [Candidatus Eremiobacteraeota bacterium]|nr:NAD(P)-binding domain-containing protein [Candidatus Eremiobacteraeota bacterium]
MKVGVLGSGDVGKALARGFVSRGHEVMVGTSDPPKLADFAREANCKTGSFAETAAFGEMIALATRGRATPKIIEDAGKQKFTGKVVIDVTNPLVFGEGPPTLDPSGTDSGGEQNQRTIPDAKVVKAFNTVGNQLFVDPKLPGGPPTMFIAGDDATAKRTVPDICKAWGWEVAHVGPISSAR